MLLHNACLNTQRLTSLVLLLLTSLSLHAQPMAGGTRVVGSNVQTIRAGEYKLLQCVLAADGSSQQVQVVLPQLYALTASAQSGTRSLYVLRKYASDSSALLLTDSLGRVVRLTRLVFAGAHSLLRPLPPPQLVGLAGGQGFVLLMPTKTACLARCLTTDLSTRWTRELPAEPILQALANETHLWILQQKLLTEATPLPLIHTCALASGELVYQGSLQTKDELEAASLVPEGLLLLGHSDTEHVRQIPAGQATPRTKRVDFLLVIKPNGQRHLAQSVLWPSGKRPAFHWQGAYALPGGSYQLIGQTFRQVPNAETIILAAIGGLLLTQTGTGFFMIGNYLNEQPTGLILARRLPTGLLTDLHTLTVPETLPSTLLVVDTTATSPTHSAAFHSLGLSPDHRFLILNTYRQVLLYEPGRHALRPLVATRPAVPTVLSIEPNQVIVGWGWQPDRALPDLERVTWP
ncbi:hypothetical protein GCM10022409_44700 [Hymenobacter glaciei]|uniref:Uncharacterized protein n=1 Tax=Hymenobacter glaciei TaxID=877209 RepID=A0ABP7UU63_9BACT